MWYHVAEPSKSFHFHLQPYMSTSSIPGNLVQPVCYNLVVRHIGCTFPLCIHYTDDLQDAYLAITGAGIDTVLIRKKALVMPFQKVSKFSLTPFDFSMQLTAMTIEKLKFALPAVFTIGPDDSMEAMLKYAVLLTGSDSGANTSSRAAVAVGEGRDHVQDIVKGIIEGETRSIVSTMSMEELFKERRIFRDKVIKNVQSELDQFGLKIYNA